MNKKLMFISLILTALLFLSACNLAKSMSGEGTTGDPVADQQTHVALAVQQTQSALVPDLPAAALTPELALVSVSVDTNCRTGPGEPYEILGVLLPGQTAEVVGRSASSDNWIIKLPSNPAITCWLWGYYATVVGNTTGVTVYTPPPTPSPTISFTITYTYSFECEGYYFFRFQLVNTGPVTWESFRIVITDSTTSVTTIDSDNAFRNFTDCAPTSDNLSDLEPGEVGFGGNFNAGGFTYNPAGNSLTATFTMYSGDGMTGQSVEKSISFTP